jgi:hypothetical protein
MIFRSPDRPTLPFLDIINIFDEQRLANLIDLGSPQFQSCLIQMDYIYYTNLWNNYNRIWEFGLGESGASRVV